ncbi:MAG: ATP-binding protein [Bacteroidetes bacterium]|nr:ATP-binding protein [Bacteroidota bacterium]
MIIPRIIENDLKNLLEQGSGTNKVIIIYGARQVGKTTLVKQLAQNLSKRSEYFNCDYLDIQSLFSWENAGNLSNVVRNLDVVILDEAQRIRNIGLVLKILHDEFPHLQVIATGSSSFELSNQVNEPLTGRKRVYKLYPLTFEELNRNGTFVESKRNLNRVLRFGLYPSVILNDDKQAQENLNEITSSYLFKDILEFQYLKKPEILLGLLKLLAFQVSNEVSYTELAVKLQVDQTVVQRYVQLLEDNFVIFRLPALKRNLRNEIGKSRKIYFWDLGIRNAIIQRLHTLDTRDDTGALWENFCIAERLKFLNYHHLQVSSYFWRTYSQREIDYIEEAGGKYNAFEFKWQPGKKTSVPHEYAAGYPDSAYKTITPDNFADRLFVKAYGGDR